MFFILAGQFPKLWAQDDQCDQIGYGHQAIEQFCRRPDDSGLKHCAHHNKKRLQQCKAAAAAFSKEESGAAHAVEAPPENCCKGKATKRRRQKDGCPASIHRAERLRCQGRTGILPVSNGDAAAKDHQRSHGADHDGIQKYLHDAHQPLSGRMFHLRSSVGNGCGAHARLIGKNAAGDSDAQCLKAGTDNAACNRLG